MATSGTSSFNPAVTSIVSALYRKVGAIAEDEIPTAGMYADAVFALNALVKSWMAQGSHVWTIEEMILFTQANQYRYLLGGSTTDMCCDAFSYTLAQLALGAAAGASQVSLVSAAGITAGQNIGVLLDTGFNFWTTVNGAPSGNNVNLTAPLPSSAGPANFAYSFTTKIDRPLLIPRARLLTFNGMQEIPMTVLSHKGYMNLPQKSNPGTPTQFHYQPKLVSGQMFLWPNPISAFWGIRGTWHRPLQDFNTVANTADIPQEWINALIWNGALQMAPEFDLDGKRFQTIMSMADRELETARNYDRETEDVQFAVGYDETYGG